MDQAVNNPKLQTLLRYWENKRDGDKLPSRRSIDPLEMAEWLGNIVLIDVTPEGDYRYRLYGSEFVVEFGKEMTGQSIRDLPSQQQEIIAAEYNLACQTKLPRARLYTAEFETGALLNRHDGTRRETWERLVLPMSSDGETVDMLLVAAYEMPPTPW